MAVGRHAPCSAHDEVNSRETSNESNLMAAFLFNVTAKQEHDVRINNLLEIILIRSKLLWCNEKHHRANMIDN